MKTLFKTLLSAALILSVGAFCSCSKDNGGDEDIPSVSVSPTEGLVQLSGGTVSTIIKTENKWTLTLPAGITDVIPSKTSGKGEYVLNIEVGPSEVKRSIPVTVTVTGKISGFPVTKTATFTINQNNGGTSIYYENCGEKVSKGSDGYWPNADKFDGWNPQGGEGIAQADVKYSGKDASVRNSGDQWAPGDDSDCSGAPYAYINKAASTFLISKINLKEGEKSYTFNFTAFDQYAGLSASPYTPACVPVTTDVVTLSVSVDGEKWANLKFDSEPTGAKGWCFLSAPFTLPAEAKQLYVQFSGFKPDTTTALPSSDYAYQASLRIDDFELCTGGNGPVIDFNDTPGPEPTEATAEAVKKGGAGTYKVTGTVVAEGTTGFIFGDKTGALYVYKKDNKLKKGDKITVTGEYKAYNQGFEFDSPTIATATSADAYTYNPKAITGADLDEMLKNGAECKEFEFSGEVAVATYVNITVAGAATAVAGLSAVNTEDYKKYEGQNITVKGFHIANGQNKYCNFVPYEIITDPNAPVLSLSSATLSFEVAGGTQTITATTNDLEGYKLEASSDNEAFAVAVDGKTISVTAGAATEARKGTLTVTYSNGTKSISKTAALKQSGPSTGGEKTITMTIDDIKNGKSGTVELGKSSYGSQAETDEATWYAWSSTADFAGCRICEGNGDGTQANLYKTNVLQIQGNADHKGFILNTTALGKIKSIEVVCLNSKDTSTPAYTMYFGTSKNPSENGEKATGAKVEGTASPFSFTDVFEPAGSYSYFKLLNDDTHAVYLQSIKIVYVE